MAGNVSELSDDEFEEKVIKSTLPTLVDFWAPWCGPCKSIAPILDELSKEYQGQILIYKINVDDNSRVAAQYGIRAIPNIIIFKGGQEVDRVVGAIPRQQLLETIKKVLAA